MAYKGLNARLDTIPKTIPGIGKQFNQKVYADSFMHSLSYEEVVINNQTTTTPVHILSNGKVPTVKSIVMYPGLEIKAGDIITRENTQVWLCEYSDKSALYSKGRIEQCNLDLKWIDSNGIIQTHPCVFYFNTRSNFGIEEDRRMNMPDGRRQATVQRNRDTEKISRDDRFVFGKEAFKVIDTDYVSDEGLVNLSFESDQINSTDDNLELGIANYWSKLSDYKINILNGSYVSINKDQTLKLNISVYNKNTHIQDPKLFFSISDDSMASVDINGIVTPHSTGSVRVTVSLSDNITAYIDIQITETTSYNYSVDIIGEESIRIGRTSTYTCQFMNNGEHIFDESTFSLTSSDGSPTSLASIVSQDSKTNICTIKANDKQMYGEVLLHVSNLNGLSTGNKKIKIKSLF
ncbi:MAG: Ig-like domain-containing protein [Bacillota bacterium]